MILSALGLKGKIFIGAIIVLLLGIGILGWQYRAEVRDKARILADKQQLQETLQANEQALEAVRQERDNLERTLAERAEEAREIKAAGAAREQELKAKIEALREQHGEVDKFLRITVPRAFADWLRKRAADSDAVRDDKGGAAASSAGAEG